MSEIIYLNEKGSTGAVFVHPVGNTLIGHTWSWNPETKRIEAYCSCEDITYVAPEEGIREDQIVP